MKRKKLMLFASLLVTTLFLISCGANETPESEVDSNEEMRVVRNSEENNDADYGTDLIMGLDDTFAPMGFRDESGELVGFDIDLSKEIAERLGINISYQPIDWAMKETELQAGNIDFIWNGYSVTDERKEKVAFSDTYMENAQIIVVSANSDIQTKEDLAGKVVTTQAESATIEAMNREPELVESFSGGAPVEYATFTECFNDLDSGRADALVGDKVLVAYTMNQKGPDAYKVLEDDFGSEEFAIGMRKEDMKLVEDINKALTNMREDGTYDEIYSKWFSE